MQYFYLILFVSGALLLLSIMYFISCKNLISSVTLSLLVLLLVVVLGWWICSNFVHKYALEEACETISELKDEDKKKLVEDIVSHNKFLDCFAFGLARVDTNKYPDLFPDAEIASSEAECEVLVKGRRSILPYFFALSCVLSLILFGCIFEGIIMEGEPL